MDAFLPGDKSRILDILCAAFEANPSVNYIAGAGPGRERRIRALMDYSFERCRLFGKVYLTDDRHACALVVYPDRRRFSLRSLGVDLKLLYRCIGLRRLRKTLQREAIIGRQHPAAPFSYLWFIGVDPEVRGQGHGTELLQRVIAESVAVSRPVYLETSATANLPWYTRAGFRILHRETFGYTLYFLRLEAGE